MEIMEESAQPVKDMERDLGWKNFDPQSPVMLQFLH